MISSDASVLSQQLNEMTMAVKFYKEVLHHDNMDIEAIACIGTYYFYTDQPEVALKFYRWALNLRGLAPFLGA